VRKDQIRVGGFGKTLGPRRDELGLKGLGESGCALASGFFLSSPTSNLSCSSTIAPDDNDLRIPILHLNLAPAPRALLTSSQVCEVRLFEPGIPTIT
jgi:hypothetical protein